jgi:hypothetical protein
MNLGDEIDQMQREAEIDSRLEHLDRQCAALMKSIACSQDRQIWKIEKAINEGLVDPDEMGSATERLEKLRLKSANTREGISLFERKN